MILDATTGDTELHFEIVHKILKPGGMYALRTPHRQSGPHDVSRWFADEPEGLTAVVDRVAATGAAGFSLEDFDPVARALVPVEALDEGQRPRPADPLVEREPATLAR